MCKFAGNKYIIHMDYTNIPRELIYFDRKSYDEFINDNSLNKQLIANLRQLSDFNTTNDDTLLFSCLNTAYYICTIAVMASNENYWGIDNSWAGIREITFRAVNDNPERYQKIILSLAIVFDSHLPDNDHILSPLIGKIGPFLNEKYQQDALVEYRLLMNGTEGLVLYKDSFEPICTIQAIDSSDIPTIGRGYKYIEESILKIEDRSLQLFIIDFALKKCKRSFVSDTYHVESRLDSLRYRILHTHPKSSTPNNDSINIIESENKRLKSSVEQLKKELKAAKGEAESLKTKIENLEKDQKTIDKQGQRIKEQQEELERLTEETNRLKQENNELSQRGSDENEGGETIWIECFDGFLHDSLNPQAIAQALSNITHPYFQKNERGFWWVFVTVLTEIHWITKSNYKMALQWANLHFNCGWEWQKDNQFKFSDINKKIRAVQPSSKWNKNATGNVIGDYYGELAKTMKDTFVIVVDGDKLLDKKEFIKPGFPYINNGRK